VKVAYGVLPAGRIGRSARARSCRAISIDSPVSTSFAASRRILVLRGSDLRLDDLDGQVLLLRD